jgi:hypothetical protein
VQPGGEHVDEHLVPVGRDGGRELLVAGRGFKRENDGGFNDGLQ